MHPNNNGTPVKNPRPVRPGQAAFRIFLLGCLANLTATGCFVPQPVEDIPAPSSNVQIRLSDPAQMRISRQAGRPVTGVTGEVVQADGDSIIVAVRWREIARGSTGRIGPDVVRLSQVDVAEMYEPQFSLTRTIVFAGIITAVGIFVVGGLLEGGSGSSNDTPGDDDGPNTM